MSQGYHLTTRERALEILAHGFSNHDAVGWEGADGWHGGVRVWVHPAVGVAGFGVLGKFKITETDGVPVEWLPEPDLDPDDEAMNQEEGEHE